jgi:hypothetical protein
MFELTKRVSRLIIFVDASARGDTNTRQYCRRDMISSVHRPRQTTDEGSSQQPAHMTKFATNTRCRIFFPRKMCGASRSRRRITSSFFCFCFFLIY